MAKFMETLATKEDGAAHMPDTEVDTITDGQPLLYSRSLSVTHS